MLIGVLVPEVVSEGRRSTWRTYVDGNSIKEAWLAKSIIAFGNKDSLEDEGGYKTNTSSIFPERIKSGQLSKFVKALRKTRPIRNAEMESPDPRPSCNELRSKTANADAQMSKHREFVIVDFVRSIIIFTSHNHNTSLTSPLSPVF